MAEEEGHNSLTIVNGSCEPQSSTSFYFVKFLVLCGFKSNLVESADLMERSSFVLELLLTDRESNHDGQTDWS